MREETPLPPPVQPAAPLIPPPVAFEALPPARLARMVEAGTRLISTARLLAKTGCSIVEEMVGDEGRVHDYAHYPQSDVVDPESGARFFFHRHPMPWIGGEAPQALGHFHCFLPAPEPVTRGARRGSGLAHIVGIAIDRQGMPSGLFTTNRWVTDETWVEAPEAARLVDRFVVELARPSMPAAIWVTAVVQLFQPQVLALLGARDAAVDAHSRRFPGGDALEDEALAVPSAVAVSVEAQLASLRTTLVPRAR